MNHFKWLGQTATIMKIQQSLHDNMQTCEITLLGQGHPVKAHRFILSACSNFLRLMLADLPRDCECSISIPDVKANTLQSVISFIYLGEVNITSGELSEFLQAINILGIKSAISFECNVTSIASVMGMSNENSMITISAMDTTTCLSTMMMPRVTVKDHNNGGILSNDPPSSMMMIKDHQSSINEKSPPLNIGGIEQQQQNNSTGNSDQLLTTGRNMDFVHFYPETTNEKINYNTMEKGGAGGGGVGEGGGGGGSVCNMNTIDHDDTHKYIINNNDPCPKLTPITNLNIREMNEDDDGMMVDSNNIIEEYSNSEDRLMQMNTNSQTNGVLNEQHLITNNITNNNDNNDFTIFKGDIHSNSNNNNNNTIITTTINNNTNTITITTNNNHNHNNAIYMTSFISKDSQHDNNGNDELNELNSQSAAQLSPTDLAYQSIIHEGLSLPKAASKYKVSKSLLWRKVRNTGVKNYVEATININQPANNEQNNAIEEACKAVVTEGLSLQKAAIKFDVSKTVLWRRVSKHPDYMKIPRENPIVSKACERLKTGEPLKSISKDLDIPMSTLHRYKVRLLLNGDLPDFVSCRRRDKLAKINFQKNLEKAVHACIYKGISQNHAAHLYAISKSTLWRHLQKRVAEAEAEAAENAAAAAAAGGGGGGGVGCDGGNVGCCGGDTTMMQHCDHDVQESSDDDEYDEDEMLMPQT